MYGGGGAFICGGFHILIDIGSIDWLGWGDDRVIVQGHIGIVFDRALNRQVTQVQHTHHN